MRLWSLHPKYLDAKGLVALWRETLLAQKVLQGETKGYQNHPQLLRFRGHEEPLKAIGYYLKGVHDEARERQYHFDASKINSIQPVESIMVTSGQLAYEWDHLKVKLEQRAPDKLEQIHQINTPHSHPIFTVQKGPIESWERIST
ncbi:pyrimidine dimer DNA glycosylase/endonuclease V [Alkalibacillus aidingensis]|uniref:pyrimidine dimer DNA glycosylase/endonuclease V n=1 Tax=Alkalibacillus aidingensis TaxID=2747607 RepID=UPI001660ED8A|nr:pyrimidine dimer DNA glycosylase/endonuclease V [Alkalibacillus aidingensis]